MILSMNPQLFPPHLVLQYLFRQFLLPVRHCMRVNSKIDFENRIYLKKINQRNYILRSNYGD